MNIQEFKKVFPVLRKHKIVPFLHGNQGIGKTQTVKQIAQEQGLGFIHLHLATQEVGDLVGLLMKRDNGTVYHARPEWFPTEGQGIIFLDELNRAHPEVLQAMFSFITEGTMHTHKLPTGWNIVAAGNYQNNEFNTTDMSDAAWLSRFCHIDFKPTIEEFILYAEDSEHFDVAGFIRENGEMLERTAKQDNLNFITPDRRAWLTMVAPLDSEETIEQERFELYSGCVGSAAAAAYISYKNKKEKVISARQIINGYNDKIANQIKKMGNAKNSRLDLLNKTTEEVLLTIEKKPEILKDEKKLENIMNFILDLPKEMLLMFFDKLKTHTSTEKNLLLNNVELVKAIKHRIKSK